jgi:ClpP class serine protease
MAAEELERFYAFREAEARVRREISADFVKEIKAEALEWGAAEKSPYKTEGGVANIGISGTLEPKRTVSSSLYDETTTYEEIEEAVRAAEADPLVEKIRFNINSSGGNWDGVDCCAEVIKRARKPTEAVIYTGAHSAAYYLASQCGKIYAATKGSAAGSIGVAVEYFDREKQEEQKGIRRYVFTNTESADKRPKVSEPEGAAVIRDRLDQYYTVFENRVIEGRRRNVPDFTAENVRQLKGRSILAEKAMETGLIDGILSEMPPDEPKNKLSGGQRMTLEEFLNSNAEAKTEFDARVEKQVSEKAAERAECEKASLVMSDRSRILEILSLSGAKISDETKKAVEIGADAGEYAKARLKSLTGGLNVPNADALGSPEPETHKLCEDGGGESGEKESVSLTEASIRAIGKAIGGKR